MKTITSKKPTSKSGRILQKILHMNGIESVHDFGTLTTTGGIKQAHIVEAMRFYDGRSIHEAQPMRGWIQKRYPDLDCSDFRRRFFEVKRKLSQLATA